ncbi:hypothetical protein [Flocculibacter collagenilyticus]|uniref:hypothetical protein n=1 Tax=Flocculibacter collagenilyticus TaxID=2744479 RepID=UPI0018F51793|nr:hypothetical protein [Flocculibacter collagenilyticus]
MGALALGIVLIIGYYYQSKHPYRRLELVRSTGYHIYFKAGLSGFLFLALASLIWGVLDYANVPSQVLEGIIYKHSLTASEKHQHWDLIKAIGIFILMFLLSTLLIAISHLFNTKQKSFNRVTNVAHELELLIINATKDVMPVRIELDCGKLYVGIPETPNLEHGEVKYITILPLLSGYVDEQKKIVFNNNYYRHYQNNIIDMTTETHPGIQLVEDIDKEIDDSYPSIGDFSIVIPVDSVIVASRFSIEAYIKFRHESDTQPSVITGNQQAQG